MVKRYITAFLAGVAACVMLETATDQLMQRRLRRLRRFRRRL